MKDTETAEGNKLELPVKLSDCYPVPKVEWFKNGEPYVPEENQIVDRTSADHKLIRQTVVDLDQGQYTFKASNELGNVESSCQVTILVKPTFVKQLEPLSTNINAAISWEFDLKSKPVSTFKLFKDNREIKLADRFLIEKTDKSEFSYALNVKLVEAADAGSYKIVATNKCGSTNSTEAALSVTGSACIIRKPNAHVFIAEKKPIKIEFEVAGVPLPEVEWFRNGEPLVAEGRLKIDVRRAVHILNFESVLMEDAAEFTLKAKNISGEASESFTLVIQTPPVFSKSLETAQSFKSGEQFELEAQFNGFPIPTVIWSKDRTLLPESDKVVITTESIGQYQTSTKLVVKNLGSEDSGSYQATIKNPIGQVSTQCKVNIVLLPHFVKPLSLSSCSTQTAQSKTDQYDIISVNEKSNLKLECQLSGTPKPTIKWYKDNVELQSTDKIKLETKLDIHLLTIKDCQIKDRAVYSIKAENNAGQSESKILLDINSSPVVVKGIQSTELTLGEANQTHQFISVYQSKPKADVLWLLDDKQIKDDPHYVIVDELNSDDTYTTKLTIQDVTLSDSGTYKCKLKNCAGENASTGTLAILKAQLFVEQLQPLIELSEKSEIKLEVKIDDSNPKSTVSWFKDGEPLTASKRFAIGTPVLAEDKKSTIFNLVIAESLGTDSGVYTFKSVSKITTIESSCEVNVLSAPKIVKELKPIIQSAVKDNLTLEVTASGKPDPEFKWFHFDYDNNEIEIVPTELISVSKNKNIYSLQFNNITGENKGKYILRLTNNAGQAEATCQINIDGNKSLNKKILIKLLNKLF